ncbi:helix-turn-helix domain-containing protein [Rheinheimera sp. UJ51]|uniref:helix-turn-helix domain-containing protein n=1 Tax=Rheinheimera sp. UJ51 TaxID=2892446 RepID=UPI001E2C9A88|nr:helix-turn-helix domain-containing protein [Rheinheimera sp. UJ51]MCC5451687.1 helix-turn-helix domain-containing protein [Rheinheimera sp. UJ51]
MSRKATDWAWRYQATCSTVKLVLLALADRADDDCECYPSVERVGADTGLNRKTVIKATRELEQVGAILDTGKRKGATQRVKVYRLNLSVETVPKTEPFQKRNDSKNGTLNSTKNGTLNSTKNGTQNQSVEPVIEPLIDQPAVDPVNSSKKWFDTLWKEYAALTGGALQIGSKKAALKTWLRLTKGYNEAKLRYQVNVCLAFHEMRRADPTIYGTKQGLVAYLNQEVWLSDDEWLNDFNQQYQQQLENEQRSGAENGSIN